MEQEDLARGRDAIEKKLHILDCAKQQEEITECAADRDRERERLRLCRSRNADLKPERDRLGIQLKQYYKVLAAEKDKGMKHCREAISAMELDRTVGEETLEELRGNEKTLSVQEGELHVEETDMTAPYNPDTSSPVFKQPGLVPMSELEEILPTLNRISSWIESVFAYISSEAINHGVPIKGYKVVEGRSKRVFTDVKAVADKAVQNGFTDIYKQQMITLTEFEKLMGKKKFAELLGEFVAKPPGKLALVPDSDPRPPVEIQSDAFDEFEALE
jgi:hypothetical protein